MIAVMPGQLKQSSLCSVYIMYITGCTAGFTECIHFHYKFLDCVHCTVLSIVWTSVCTVQSSGWECRQAWRDTCKPRKPGGSPSHCIVYTVYCTLYSVHCILSTVYCIVYIVYCNLYTVYYPAVFCTCSVQHGRMWSRARLLTLNIFCKSVETPNISCRNFQYFLWYCRNSQYFQWDCRNSQYFLYESRNSQYFLLQSRNSQYF